MERSPTTGGHHHRRQWCWGTRDSLLRGDGGGWPWPNTPVPPSPQGWPATILLARAHQPLSSQQCWGGPRDSLLGRTRGVTWGPPTHVASTGGTTARLSRPSSMTDFEHLILSDSPTLLCPWRRRSQSPRAADRRRRKGAPPERKPPEQQGHRSAAGSTSPPTTVVARRAPPSMAAHRGSPRGPRATGVWRDQVLQMSGVGKWMERFHAWERHKLYSHCAMWRCRPIPCFFTTQEAIDFQDGAPLFAHSGLSHPDTSLIVDRDNLLGNHLKPFSISPGTFGNASPEPTSTKPATGDAPSSVDSTTWSTVKTRRRACRSPHGLFSPTWS